jgi:single-strand DNA-binding protein
MNLAVFTGNIGGEPRINSVQTTNGPTAVLNFSLATEKSKKDPATGKRITLWIDCSIWGARADALHPYLRKGSKVTVHGEVDVETYQAKDLTVQAKLTLRVADIALQGDAQPQGQQTPAQQAAPQQHAQQQAYNRPSPGFHANGSAAPNNHQGTAQPPHNYNQQQSRGPAEPNIDFDDDIPF